MGFAEPTPVGKLQVSTATAELQGVSEPLVVDSATVLLQSQLVNMTSFSASFSKGGQFNGSATFPIHCTAPENCVLSFIVRAQDTSLARLNHPEEAEHQLRLAIETNPSLPEPHDLLGTILKNEGHSEAALQEYREAIRVRPGFNRGYLDLGIAQAETGDLAGATQNLRKAAAGNDPAIRQKAQQILKQLSQ